jgi:hypothetical protein
MVIISVLESKDILASMIFEHVLFQILITRNLLKSRGSPKILTLGVHLCLKIAGFGSSRVFVNQGLEVLVCTHWFPKVFLNIS